MFWLALAGLAISVAGGVFGAIGQGQANQQARADAEREAQQLRESQQVYQSQQADIKLGMEAQGKYRDLALQSLSIQGAQTARAGAAAVGSVGARAGVGNLGGASVLRQAASIRRNVGEQMTLIGAEREKVGIGYELGMAQSRTQLLQSELGEKWAGENAQASQDQADWLRRYGWLSVAAVGLGGAANVVSQASNTPWETLSGNPFKVGSTT